MNYLGRLCLVWLTATWFTATPLLATGSVRSLPDQGSSTQGSKLRGDLVNVFLEIAEYMRARPITDRFDFYISLPKQLKVCVFEHMREHEQQMLTNYAIDQVLREHPNLADARLALIEKTDALSRESSRLMGAQYPAKEEYMKVLNDYLSNLSEKEKELAAKVNSIMFPCTLYFAGLGQVTFTGEAEQHFSRLAPYSRTLQRLIANGDIRANTNRADRKAKDYISDGFFEATPGPYGYGCVCYSRTDCGSIPCTYGALNCSEMMNGCRNLGRPIICVGLCGDWYHPEEPPQY